MSVCRLVAGLVGLALAAVVVIVLVAVGSEVIVLVAVGSEVRAELAPVVVKENPASAPPAFSSGCLQAPWPMDVSGGALRRSESFVARGRSEANREKSCTS
jgi:hypothetical protein